MSTSRSIHVEPSTPLDDFRPFDKGGYFDLGHPLLNRISDSFLKAASIGAIQAVSREAYFTAVEGGGSDSAGADITGARRNRFPSLRGDSSNKSLEAMVKNTGKEAMQWGLAAGMYSGLTYGLKEARGSHDWKNSAVAGALTGMTLALTSDDATHDHVLHFAVTGAAISAAANLLSGIF
ncbi:hypothetical protein V2J09_023958 [Rumex salicifolius]